MTATIPSYRLYGEDGAPEPAGFAHIETIATRSALHDWEIAPHRHTRAVQLLIVERGGVTATLDGRAVTLDGPAQVTVPAGAVHGFRFAPGTHGQVLTLGQAFASRAGGRGDPLARLLAEGSHGPLAPETARRIALLAGELLGIVPDGAGHGPFHALAEALLRCLPAAATPMGEDDRRLARFRELVEAHMTEHRPLAFYAAAIGTTERTLARLVRRRLGCSPGQAIDRRLALEAQRLLRYTNASIAQVADQLGFADPSWFSRFYLRTAGRRPSAERA